MKSRLAFIGFFLCGGIFPASASLNLDSPYGIGSDRIVEFAADEGWTVVSQQLTNKAFDAYENGEKTAVNWYYLSRWADLLASNEGDVVSKWIDAIDKAKLGHKNMAQRYTLYKRPLNSHFSLSLQKVLLGDFAFSREFFDLLSPYDYLPGVLQTLNHLHGKNRKYFYEYRRLALAIAVVYDVPPPPGWPHFQVPDSILPRELPDIDTAFDYWVDLNERGQCPFDLSKMSVEELKFIVDTPAMDDFQWVQENIHNKPDKFADVYGRINYRFDRVMNNQFIWRGKDYQLKTILNYGGICVDQAYFAAQAGKAKGIPTLVFRGAGMDGRHAWFGFMPDEGVWEFNGGREGDNRYVTGYAHDPQTWANITDHQLQFLGERFHHSYYYQKSLLHANFANRYLEHNDPVSAQEVAENALRFEKRNQIAWEALYSATGLLSDDPRETEKVLRRAAQAFRYNPDLETYYLNRVIKNLENRGEGSRAQREKYLLTIKNKGDRKDISIQQAADRLLENMADDPLAARLRYFRVILLQLGKVGGIDVYDRIVMPFVQQLTASGYKREAYQMLVYAREKFDARSGSMLDLELKRQLNIYKP